MDWPTPTGRIVIAGGSGFLGTALASHLHDLGCEVVVLSRATGPSNAPWRFEQWDAMSVGPWMEQLNGAAAIVNIAGRTVDCIKTPEHCDEILRSRVEATLVLGEACRAVDRPPPVWVQMSTAHIYGDPPDVSCDETSPFGYGLAPDVGRAWEQAFAESKPDSTRGVVLRTSFVLGRSGGAMKKLSLLTRLGLGGKIGSGKQGMSWIHVHDMNRIFERAIADQSMEGAYIASAPNPVSQRDFMAALRRAVRMPIGLPAFAWMVRIGAPLFLRTDPDLALYGRFVVPKRLVNEGFTFEFDEINAAMADLYR